MRENFFIQLRDWNAEGGIACAIRSADPERLPSLRVLPAGELAAAAAGRRVIGVVPESDVRLASVELPVRQAARARQAAPYMLEEHFAEDVERLHFAVGKRAQTGEFPVVVAAHERMQQWTSLLAGAGVRADVLVPETLCLPLPAPEWPVLAETGRLLVRTGAHSGFGALPEDFLSLLELAEQGAPRPVKLLVVDRCEIDFSLWQRPLEVLAGFPSPLDVYARHYSDATTVNLLQGRYSVAEEWQRHLMPWRLPAILAGATLAIALVVTSLQALKAQHEARQELVARVDRWHTIFPAVPADEDTVDSLIDVKSSTRGAGASKAVLPLLAQVGNALSANPGWQVQTIQFRDGALFIDLTGTDLEALERLRSWFASHPGATLAVQTANAASGSVQVRIKVLMA